MNYLPIIVLFLLLLTGCDCSVDEISPSQKGTLVQVSVIDALLQGIYDGYYPVGELTQYGNFGIGTFDGLDGEMIVYNDTVFQVLATGAVKKPDLDVLTPFAAVTPFYADTAFSVEELNFEQLKADFNSYFPTENLFYAVRIKGEFTYMKTRSVPKQNKPYPPLVEVTKDQPEFEFENVKGDIIGFYCPAYAQGINVTGLHLHFLNQSRTGGGHILAFSLKQGTLEIGYLMNYKLILPEGGDFYGGDFTIDRSNDLEEAEG